MRFHKDNLRHLLRFPDFFVTFRILSPFLISFGIIISGNRLSKRVISGDVTRIISVSPAIECTDKRITLMIRRKL